MVKVNIHGQGYECIKAVKGSNYVILYDEYNSKIASFEGISDFSGYSIEGGEWEVPEDDEKNQRLLDLELAIAQILGGGI